MNASYGAMRDDPQAACPASTHGQCLRWSL